MTKRTNASAATIAYLAAAEQLIIAMPDGTLFISADILNMMRANGWPELRERRNVGPMLLRLRRRGYVAKIGERSTSARSHGGVTSEWQRTRHPS